MRDRTGQVWRKGQSKTSDIIVISSSEESRKMGLKTGIALTKGTNHVIVRFFFNNRTFEQESWYEPDSDRWEDKIGFTRTA